MSNVVHLTTPAPRQERELYRQENITYKFDPETKSWTWQVTVTRRFTFHQGEQHKTIEAARKEAHRRVDMLLDGGKREPRK
jgi:hypothetical protein